MEENKNPGTYQFDTRTGRLISVDEAIQVQKDQKKARLTGLAIALSGLALSAGTFFYNENTVDSSVPKMTVYDNQEQDLNVDSDKNEKQFDGKETGSNTYSQNHSEVHDKSLETILDQPRENVDETHYEDVLTGAGVDNYLNYDTVVKQTDVDIDSKNLEVQSTLNNENNLENKEKELIAKIETIEKDLSEKVSELVVNTDENDSVNHYYEYTGKSYIGNNPPIDVTPNFWIVVGVEWPSANSSLEEQPIVPNIIYKEVKINFLDIVNRMTYGELCSKDITSYDEEFGYFDTQIAMQPIPVYRSSDSVIGEIQVINPIIGDVSEQLSMSIIGNPYVVIEGGIKMVTDFENINSDKIGNYIFPLIDNRNGQMEGIIGYISGEDLVNSLEAKFSDFYNPEAKSNQR